MLKKFSRLEGIITAVGSVASIIGLIIVLFPNNSTNNQTSFSGSGASPSSSAVISSNSSLQGNESSSSSTDLVQPFKVNYYLDGGINNPNNIQNYQLNIEYNLFEPSKEGNDFEGWYLNSLFTGEKIEKIKLESEQSYSLFAKWIPKTYNINFVTNSELVLSNLITQYNLSINYPNNLLREGYIFNGWYQDQELKRQAPEIMPSKDLTIFAKWTPLTYIINFFQPEERIVDLSPGYRHTLALTNTGQLFGWGNNQFGQLTFDTKDDVLSPQLININYLLEETEIIIDVEASSFSSYVITNKGNIYSWGKNNFGQLGIGNTNDTNKPTKISNLSNLADPVVKLYTSKSFDELTLRNEPFVVAQTKANKLYSWGRNNNGQLGLGNFSDTSTPSLININFNSGEEIIDISLGTSHALVLTNQKRILVWGRNNKGQLGLNNKDNKNTPTLISSSFYPQIGRIINVEAGFETSGFLVESPVKNNLYMFGKNRNVITENFRLLGIDTGSLEILTPTLVSTEFNIIEFNLGAEHGIAKTFDNKILTWGRNNFGQLGTNNNVNIKVPTELNLNTSSVEKNTRLITGSFNNFFIDKDYNIQSFGYNLQGQIGNNVKSNQLVIANTATNLPKSEKKLLKTSELNFEDQYLNFNSPSLAGYKFIGWYKDQGFNIPITYTNNGAIKEFLNPKEDLDIFALYKNSN
jgi:uncharacterized repeat protein (TIGR02543 family)